jgi:hypothetical protein
LKNESIERRGRGSEQLAWNWSNVAIERTTVLVLVAQFARQKALKTLLLFKRAEGAGAEVESMEGRSKSGRLL